MLRLTLWEVFLRSLPEEFLLVFAVYIFSKTVINVKRYIIASMFFVIAVCLIRLLPIQYGVHTILNVIVIIILTTNVNKISINKSIQASIMAVILLFICEGINVFIVHYVFKVNVKYAFSERLLKIIYSIPSLVIFAAIIFTYYFYLVRKNKLSGVINGEDI